MNQGEDNNKLIPVSPAPIAPLTPAIVMPAPRKMHAPPLAAEMSVGVDNLVGVQYLVILENTASFPQAVTVTVENGDTVVSVSPKVGSTFWHSAAKGYGGGLPGVLANLLVDGAGIDVSPNRTSQTVTVAAQNSTRIYFTTYCGVISSSSATCTPIWSAIPMNRLALSSIRNTFISTNATLLFTAANSSARSTILSSVHLRLFGQATNSEETHLIPVNDGQAW